MMQQFVIKNVKTKRLRQVTHFLILFNFLGLALLLIRNEGIMKEIWLISILLFLSFFSLVQVFLERFFEKPRVEFWYRSIFALSSTAWLKTDFWGIGALLLIFALLHYFSHRKSIVTITSSHVKLPGFINKKTEWNEISNLVLKDDILTVDFKTNRIFQEQILPAQEGVDEERFNDYCKKKIHSGFA